MSTEMERAMIGFEKVAQGCHQSVWLRKTRKIRAAQWVVNPRIIMPFDQAHVEGIPEGLAAMGMDWRLAAQI